MRKPRIRFQGYTDEWEQRKLDEYLDVSTDKNKDNRYGKEDVLSVSGDYGIVNQIEFQGRSFAGASVANYGVVNTGDIVYTKSPLSTNPYGIIKANKGKPGIVSTLYAVYKPCKNVNPEFVQVYFELNSRMNNYMQPLVNKGAKNDMKVTAENALKGGVCFPELKEQDAIVDYFKNLDHLITLHQRKCEETKALKKYMLQKMFPQNGQSVPEIRFSGFTEDWKQRKCKDIFDKIANPVDVKAEGTYREIGIRSHGKGLFYKDEVTGEELGNKRVFWVEPDCFIVNIVFAWERAVARTTEKELGMIASHRFPMYKPKNAVVDLDYITKFFVTHKGKYILEMASPGGAGRNKTLGQKEFEESLICLPSYEEQKKIGSYLDSLDHLITLHQRKCDMLKNLKKYMLQNMFPQ